MASKKVKSRKSGPTSYKVQNLNQQQQQFIAELLASESFNATAAARAVGYKSPANAAQRLLANKVVQGALGKAQREREERCELKGDDVINYLRVALFFNPLQFFTPCDEGFFVKDWKDIPEEVGRLVERMEVKEIVAPDGSIIRGYKLWFLSKAIVLPLAMKHLNLMGTEKVEVTPGDNWDKILQAMGTVLDDDIENEIDAIDVKSKPPKKRKAIQ